MSLSSTSWKFWRFCNLWLPTLQSHLVPFQQSSPKTSLSCCGIRVVQCCRSGFWMSMFMRRYRGASRLERKEKRLPSLVMYEYWASKLSTSLTHGSRPAGQEGPKDFLQTQVKNHTAAAGNTPTYHPSINSCNNEFKALGKFHCSAQVPKLVIITVILLLFWDFYINPLKFICFLPNSFYSSVHSSWFRGRSQTLDTSLKPISTTVEKEMNGNIRPRDDYLTL